jgi:hypothetical protein
MVVGKWNYEARDYDPYTIPDDWHTPLLSNDMDEVINCASCGKRVRFGECYTSKVIHAKLGFGYSVCSECHDKEWN